MRFEIGERTRANGEITRVPTDEELETLVEQLREADVEAVAVAFLHSYREAANEELVAQYIGSALSVPVTTSSALSRQWREYERFSTAAANAYVAPVAERYLRRLLGGLGDDGFRGQFVILDSSGGAMSVETARRFPVRAVESGPVAGVIGARALAEALGIDNVVVFDMGGTTTKVSLVEDGRYATMDQYWVGGRFRGFPLQVNTVDMVEIGVGGGSIAWLDESGRLRVGPRSAGSQPGPACYGLGGTQPTVTDANVYCGRLDAEHFAGALRLDVDAATEAIERLADESRMPPERLALGILEVANLEIAAAVRRQTLERGRDPQEFTLFAIGGAGPMHACQVAAEADIRAVLVPLCAGHFSALGMLGANLRLDRREVMVSLLKDLDSGALESTLERIAKELAAELQFGSNRAPDVVFQYSLAMRYKGQDHTVRIVAAEPGLALPDDPVGAFRRAFDFEYERRYGHVDEGSEIELVELEVVAERVLPSVPTTQASVVEGEKDEIYSRWVFGEDPVATSVVSRGTLAAGVRISGPIVIVEEGSTAVIPPGAVVEVANGGTLRVDLGRRDEA
jgi:N-methylhydantoinase A